MKTLFASILILIATSTLAQTDTIQVRTYGGVYNDYGSEIIETSDGGFAIIGTTGSYGQGQSNMYLLKINEDLEKEWSQVFGGDNVEWGQSLLEVEDGFLLLGYTNSFGAGGYDVYLVKCDLDGSLEWQKTYGGSDWDFGYRILEHNNGFYIAGESWSYSNGGSDGYLLHIDDEGNELWSGNFGENNDDAFYDLFVGENNIIAVGTMALETPRVYLVEIQSTDDINEYILGSNDESIIGRSGILHSNGSYYISGERFIENHWDYLFLKLNENFNLLPVSSNFYGGTGDDFAYSMVEVNNGDITMCGKSDSFTGSLGAMLLRVSHFGYFQAAPTHGGGMTDFGRCLITTTDQRLVMVGETNSYGMGNYDVYLLYFSDLMVDQQYTVNEVFYSDSLLTSAPTIMASEENHMLYPNPVRDVLYLVQSNKWNSMSFFDLKGQLIAREILDPFQDNFPLNDIPSGVYIVELENFQETHRQKIIVE